MAHLAERSTLLPSPMAHRTVKMRSLPRFEFQKSWNPHERAADRCCGRLPYPTCQSHGPLDFTRPQRRAEHLTRVASTQSPTDLTAEDGPLRRQRHRDGGDGAAALAPPPRVAAPPTPASGSCANPIRKVPLSRYAVLAPQSSCRLSSRVRSWWPRRCSRSSSPRSTSSWGPTSAIPSPAISSSPPSPSRFAHLSQH